MSVFLGDENIYNELAPSFGILLQAGYEATTSYGKGTGNAPEAVIAASNYVELYDEFLDLETWKHGIFTAPALSFKGEPGEDLDIIYRNALRYLNQDKFLVTVGGEHTITAPLVKACLEKHEDISILQLDAHADLRYSYEDSLYSHACVMRRIYEMTDKIAGVGIRAISYDEKEFIEKNKVNVYMAHQLKAKNQWEEVLKNLSYNVYLTIDVDYFDPSLLPATGTPEPGGFFWDETIQFLSNLFKLKNIIACDVVELSPVSQFKFCDFTIAKLIYRLFGFKLHKRINR